MPLIIFGLTAIDAATGDGPIGGGVAKAGIRTTEKLAAKGVEQGRDALGRFLPKNGGEVIPGSGAEKAVWDAVRQKPDWSVVEGRVTVKNAAGDVRVYDGAARSPSGKTIGLEVKSGSAQKTASQRAFDSGVSKSNPASGVGQHSRETIVRSVEIRVPR